MGVGSTLVTGGMFSAGMPAFSESMSSRFVNGKKITTKKSCANGVETVKIFENDVLVSHTVNGESQPTLRAGSGTNSNRSLPGSPGGRDRSAPYARRHRH